MFDILKRKIFGTIQKNYFYRFKFRGLTKQLNSIYALNPKKTMLNKNGKLEFCFPNKTDNKLFLMLARYGYCFNYVKNKNVLDVCCGLGWSSSLLSNYAKNVYACDFAANAISFCNNKYKAPNLSFFMQDVLKPIKASNIDVITAIECIEHFTKPDGIKFMQNCYNLLNKGGLLIMSSYFAYNGIEAKNMLKKVDVHKYIWQKKELIASIKKIGFKLYKFYYKNYCIFKKI